MLSLPQIQPREPAEYHKLSAGPDKRWYRPLLAILVIVPIYGALSTLVMLFPMAIPALQTQAYWDLYRDRIDSQDPVVFGVLMLSLIALIPAVLLGVMLGARTKVGYFFSVEGRLRWRWQGVAFLITLPIFAIFFTTLTMLDGPEFTLDAHAVGMIAMTVLLVPFQSAAEELTFRAGFLQMFGSWIPGRWVSLIVGTLASAVVFSLLHGSLDTWVLADLVVFTLFAVFLIWYTGGVEAAIALHASNNVVIFVLEALQGTSDSLIDADTTSTPGSVLFTVVNFGIVSLALVFAAKKMGIKRRHDPAKTPRPDSFYLANELRQGRFYPEWQELYPQNVLISRGIIVPQVSPAALPTQAEIPNDEHNLRESF